MDAELCGCAMAAVPNRPDVRSKPSVNPVRGPENGTYRGRPAHVDAEVVGKVIHRADLVNWAETTECHSSRGHQTQIGRPVRADERQYRGRCNKGLDKAPASRVGPRARSCVDHETITFCHLYVRHRLYSHLP